MREFPAAVPHHLGDPQEPRPSRAAHEAQAGVAVVGFTRPLVEGGRLLGGDREEGGHHDSRIALDLRHDRTSRFRVENPTLMGIEDRANQRKKGGLFQKISGGHKGRL